jgi:hypothetical protein
VQLACWFDPVVADNMLDRPVICGWHSLCNHQIYKELFYDPYHCYALVFCLPDSPRKAAVIFCLLKKETLTLPSRRTEGVERDRKKDP